MGKILSFVIGAIICIAIFLWIFKEITNVDVYENVKNDKRPFMEQVGSGIKSISTDFQKGFNSDTLDIDTLGK